MYRFYGRARETTTIDCKASSTGYKTWFLGDSGYCLNWRFHAKGTKKDDGPYRIDPYWVVAGFSKTHAVVADLALDRMAHNKQLLLPPGRHVIWMDNLFTTIKLLERLRREGVGRAGTVRTTKTPREKAIETATNSSQPASQQLPTPLASQSTQSISQLPASLLSHLPHDRSIESLQVIRQLDEALREAEEHPPEPFSDELIAIKPWRDKIP